MPKNPIVYIKSLIISGLYRKSISLTDTLAYELFGASPTISGPSITPATALRVPAVLSAVVLITGAIGSLPAKVFAVDDNGKRAAKEHPAYRLVHDEANDWTSAGQLRALLTADALLHDHGFALANRVNGRVVEFIRLDPKTVTIKYDDASGEPFYVQQLPNARTRTYPFQDILHISAPLDLSPIKAGREAIALAVVLEACAARLFNSGARPSSVFTNEKNKDSPAGAKEVKNIKAAYRAATASGNFSEPLFLDGGWGHSQQIFSTVDPQFAAMRAEQVVEIGRLFRTPPTMLFDLTHGTLANTEQMGQQFLTLTLRPWLDAWQWAYSRCLLAPEERTAGFYIEFIVDDLLKADFATRATAYAQYRAMGAMTANEVRSGLNLPGIEGGDTLDNPNITPGKPAGQNDNREPGEAAA